MNTICSDAIYVFCHSHRHENKHTMTVTVTVTVTDSGNILLLSVVLRVFAFCAFYALGVLFSVIACPHAPGIPFARALDYGK
jgi:hypothetical protein